MANNSFSLPDNEGFRDLEEENNIPMDISGFCSGLKEAWQLIPDQSFGFALGAIFNGYDLTQLHPDELKEMLNDFILQNS